MSLPLKLFILQCTIHECNDKNLHIKSIQKLLSQYGKPHSKVTCFVDPAQPQTIIMERKSVWSLLQAVVWPSVCLCIGVTMWLGVCCGCLRERDSPSHDLSHVSV